MAIVCASQPSVIISIHGHAMGPWSQHTTVHTRYTHNTLTHSTLNLVLWCAKLVIHDRTLLSPSFPPAPLRILLFLLLLPTFSSSDFHSTLVLASSSFSSSSSSSIPLSFAFPIFLLSCNYTSGLESLLRGVRVWHSTTYIPAASLSIPYLIIKRSTVQTNSRIFNCANQTTTLSPPALVAENTSFFYSRDAQKLLQQVITTHILSGLWPVIAARFTLWMLSSTSIPSSGGQRSREQRSFWICSRTLFRHRHVLPALVLDGTSNCS